MLVLLPGLICDSRVFAAQRSAFPDALFIEGYGMADSLAEMARLVLREADEAGAGQLEIFGHSMGGRVAVEILRLAPQRVSRLALASCGLLPAVEGEAEKRASIQRIGYEQGYDALIAMWEKALLAKDKREAAFAAPLREMLLSNDQAVFDAQNRALLARPPFADLIATFPGPLLSLVGSDDRMAPVAEHEQIADLAPGGELLVLEATGHMLTLEAPQATNTAIARWLAA